MGVLREKMIEEMKLRNFASRTQKSYVAAIPLCQDRCRIGQQWKQVAEIGRSK